MKIFNEDFKKKGHKYVKIHDRRMWFCKDMEVMVRKKYAKFQINTSNGTLKSKVVYKI